MKEFFRSKIFTVPSTLIYVVVFSLTLINTSFSMVDITTVLLGLSVVLLALNLLSYSHATLRLIMNVITIVLVIGYFAIVGYWHTFPTNNYYY